MQVSLHGIHFNLSFTLILNGRTRGLSHRAKLDTNQELAHFCQMLEKACIDTVEIDEIMTKDLALSIYGSKLERKHYCTTQEFIEGVESKLSDYMKHETNILKTKL